MTTGRETDTERKPGYNRVATFECTECGLQVRLATTFPIGKCDHDCRRCGEQTEHHAVTDPIPIEEADHYV